MPTPLQKTATALHDADTWSAWKAAAEEHDRLSGAEEWRQENDSPHYDAGLLLSEIADLRRLREQQEGLKLAALLTNSLYRHLGDLSAPALYTTALAGTKHLVTRYFDEVETSLRWLCDFQGIPRAEKHRRFLLAQKVHGLPALMLSGGATWGFHHLGVVKCLFEHGLLPDVLSGASTGAMIASGVCARNDAELTKMFAYTDQIRLDGLLPVSARQALQNRAWLDPEQLLAVLRHNVGDCTFAEAFAHSGRALNICVSPTRTRQKPRVLSHLTAPDVFVARAALASSALPGLFPAVVLEARSPDGTRVPYVPSERWVDGSIYEDLPKLRLARLHNVNFFIVSQTNPHVVPFVTQHGRRGIAPTVAGVASATARTQGAYAADLARRAAGSGPLQQLADRAYGLVSQDYRGDIDIHPRFRPELLTRIVRNPSRDDLRNFILEGERATWPRLSMIADQTRLGRVLKACVKATEG